MVHLTSLDYTIIIIYVTLVFGISFYFIKRANSSLAEYFVSGRSLPWWIVGISMVATTFAADTPLAVTGFIRRHGIWYNWFGWHYIFSQILAVVLFAKLWRRSGVLTDNELIELRYDGKPAAFLRGFKACLFAIVYNFIVLGWVFKALGTITLALFVDQSAHSPEELEHIEHTIIWVGAISVGLYCIIAGYWGVVVTDLFQFTMAMIGSIALAIAMVSHFGGMGELLSLLKTSPLYNKDTLSIIPAFDIGTGTPFLETTFFKFSVFITLMWWSYHNADGGGYLIQRMLSTKNEKHASLSMLVFVILNNAIRYWPWIVVALGTLVLYPAVENHNATYAFAIKDLLGPGFLGIMIVSLAGAFMSTVDTHINWASSYLINDVYKRFIRKQASEKHHLIVSKICVGFMILISAFFATMFDQIEDLWIFVWAMFSGIGSVLILRWFWWRINAWSEIAALSSSLIIAIFFEINAYVTNITYTFASSPPHVFGIALQTHHKALILVPIAVISWVIITFLTRPVAATHLQEFYDRVKPGGWWNPCRTKGTKSFLSIKKILIEWCMGIVCAYAAVFGCGWIVLGKLPLGIASLIISVGLGIVFIRKIVK